jgi:L-arabinokinase
MGGIADYSGSVVLESTLSMATFAAVQPRSDRYVKIRSEGEAGANIRECSVDCSRLLASADAPTYDEVLQLLQPMRETRWTTYLTGCLGVLLAEGKLAPRSATGLNIYISSDVPIGAGVSSSAALEVSVMTALTELFGLRLDGLEIARLCQLVENRVVGAPCGIMDQVTCSLGKEGALLALKCQPHEVLGFEAVPPGWRFVGIDSAVKHSVGGRAYASARIGAFMGYAVVQKLTGKTWDGYLCNVAVETWESVKGEVPESMTGRDFMEKYGPLPDPASNVQPGETYQVRSCAEHPILENARVREFLALMELGQRDSAPKLMEEAGALMLEAHRSYSDRVSLGSAETDLLVDIAMAEGPESGIFGAKITGGGSGGTVAILCDDGSGPAVERICREYARRTGRNPRLMSGTSPGAEEFGTRTAAL